MTAESPMHCEYLLIAGMTINCLDSYCPPRRKCDHIIKPRCWDLLGNHYVSKSTGKVLEESWRFCPTCKNRLIYSHRVTINSWTYICQNCKTTHHITEEREQKTIEVVFRNTDIYDKQGKLQQQERER